MGMFEISTGSVSSRQDSRSTKLNTVLAIRLVTPVWLSWGCEFEAIVHSEEKLETHLLPGKTDTSLAASPPCDLLNTSNLH